MAHPQEGLVKGLVKKEEIHRFARRTGEARFKNQEHGNHHHGLAKALQLNLRVLSNSPHSYDQMSG